MGLPDAVESAVNELGIVMKRHGMKATTLFAEMKAEEGGDRVSRSVFMAHLEEVSHAQQQTFFDYRNYVFILEY